VAGIVVIGDRARQASPAQSSIFIRTSTVKILETERLIIRQLSVEDAPFIFGLVNEPSWLRFIGDKKVRTIDDARNYILKGPIESYERNGFGLYLVESKETGDALGICGLIKRESLNDVDIGFAFLPRFWGKGYAIEAGAAVIELGKTAFGLRRIVAITSPDNHSSIKVLERLGMRIEGLIQLAENEPEVKLFALDA
jgi:RimJ/RimL family protein N-acetyltransferase